jgi:hypothetical protein
MNLIEAAKKALREGKKITTPDHHRPLQFEDGLLWFESDGDKKIQYSLDKEDILSTDWRVI